MSVAPTPPPHTPVLYLKAGSPGKFTDDCVTALAKVGYDPSDFGDYDQVRAKIKAAKGRREVYEDQQRAAGAPIDPKGPDARTAMLARSQAGHLSQDDMFRADGSRGNGCGNHRPPGPGEARGYNVYMAPCMPMQSYGGTTSRPRDTIGSPHWAVSQNEADQRIPGTTVNSTQMSAQCVQNTGIVTGANTVDYDNHMAAGFRATKKSSARARASQAQKRRELAASTQQAAASELPASGGAAAGDDAQGQKDKDMAAKCIDAWRQWAQEEMRRKAIEKYGTNYDQTKKAALAEQTAAQNAVNTAPINGPLSDHAQAVENDARATLANPSASAEDRATAQRRLDNPYRAANQDRSAAKQRLARADNEVAGLDCMNCDVHDLCNPGGPPAARPPADPPGQFTPPSPLPGMPPFEGAF
jgi:hypothetical protein